MQTPRTHTVQRRSLHRPSRPSARVRIGFTVIIVVGSLVPPCMPAGIDDLVVGSAPEKIATGFRFTEGPLWHSDGYLLFSDIPANTIYKWTPDGEVTVFRSPSGYANGLTFDRQGRLIACEHVTRRVTRTELDGSVTVLADRYDGKRLNSPNDAVVRSDGTIYFTDPPFGLNATYGVPGTQELPFMGIYRISADGESLALMNRGLGGPNGLAFSPDERVLYVADSSSQSVYAFDAAPNGSISNMRLFARIGSASDGMKVDALGNLYVTTNSRNVRVFSDTGASIGLIGAPEGTTNCAFGGFDHQTLFISANTSVYAVQTKVQSAHTGQVPPNFNDDLTIDIEDLSIMIDHWQQDYPLCDITPPPFGDGMVDRLDLELFMTYWDQELTDPTLLAHWTLDESEGDVAYDSAGHNDAILNGGPVWLPEGGQQDGALQFDGNDDYIGTPFVHNPGAGPFSIFAWAQGGGPEQVIVSQFAGKDGLLVDADGALITNLRKDSRGPDTLSSSAIVIDGSWHHVGLTWDGTTRSLYVDDVLVAEDEPGSMPDSSEGLNIGCGPNLEAGSYFSGLIDDVRIYNRAITP